MQHHKKIYYTSGMLSAIFIPIIFLFYAIPTFRQINVSAIDIALPDKESATHKIPEEYQFPAAENGWKYESIDLPADFSKEDERKFYNRIKELQEKEYDKIGLRFQFNDNNNYNDFVRLLNLMLKTKQESYGFRSEDNSFYVVKFKQIEERELKCGTDSTMTSIQSDEWVQKNKLGEFAYFLSKLPKEIFYIIFGFIFLVYSAILKPKILIKF